MKINDTEEKYKGFFELLHHCIEHSFITKLSYTAYTDAVLTMCRKFANGTFFMALLPFQLQVCMLFHLEPADIARAR